MKKLFFLLISFIHFNALSAVILQYHHVSNNTPASTSIAPEQFEAHLQYLKDHNFNVVPLSDIIDGVKKQQPLPDKTVAITFDDAFTDILTQGKPLLDKFNFPFTIFINPGIVDGTSKSYLSWAQLKEMADQGVIIANHGFEHDSMVRSPEGMTAKQWLNSYGAQLIKAERIIEEKTGQSWRYFAYPYGEYSPEIQQWMTKNNFSAFTQQSGAIGLATDLTIIPRFPASKPYDQISSLRDKLNSLPFTITLEEDQANTIFDYQQATSVTFNVNIDDFYKSQLNCFVSGLGRQKVEWLDDNSFTINFSKPLPPGRIRCNCTAASISKPGRYYWYSKPWLVLKKDGSWFHL